MEEWTYYPLLHIIERSLAGVNDLDLDGLELTIGSINVIEDDLVQFVSLSGGGIEILIIPQLPVDVPPPVLESLTGFFQIIGDGVH